MAWRTAGDACYDCGACTGLGVEHVVASSVAPAGGSQGTGQDLLTGGAVPVHFRPTPTSVGAGAVLAVRWRGARLMKIRIRFSKLGRVRWTSHRDVARMWERALRRARLPMAYTEGFSPRPKLSFGLALPTGCESNAEYLDVALSEPVAPEEVTATFSSLLPDGVDVLAAQVLASGAGSLQEEVTRADGR